MLKNLGTSELVLIVVILIFLFGGSKIPQLIKGIGEAIREFKKSSRD